MIKRRFVRGEYLEISFANTLSTCQSVNLSTSILILKNIIYIEFWLLLLDSLRKKA